MPATRLSSVPELYAGLLICVGVLGCEMYSDGASESLQLDNEVVEISCGECQFDMNGDGCDLAIRHQDVCYFVQGSDIDDHGDAHAAEGLCNCVRLAKVTGEIKDDQFQATNIELLPDAPSQK